MLELDLKWEDIMLKVIVSYSLQQFTVTSTYITFIPSKSHHQFIIAFRIVTEVWGEFPWKQKTTFSTSEDSLEWTVLINLSCFHFFHFFYFFRSIFSAKCNFLMFLQKLTINHDYIEILQTTNYQGLN